MVAAIEGTRGPSPWLSAIQGVLTFFESQLGLGAGLGIVALTLVLRTLILPISWRVAYRGSIRQKKMFNPDLPQHMRLLLILVPSIFAAVAALKLCSALAVYWTVSNCYSAVQTSVLHYVVARRIRSGAVSI
jgi:membrane protein insertase Oxa1/YidC/SpoIIIJ